MIVIDRGDVSRGGCARAKVDERHPEEQGKTPQAVLPARGDTRCSVGATVARDGLTLYTRNPGDFAGLEEIVSVVAV
jgi:hypothetical protein